MSFSSGFPEKQPEKKRRKLGQRREQDMPKIRAYVATPAYDGKVHSDYAISLAESCIMAGRHDIGVMAAVMGNGAFIELSRNTFVKLFLDSPCTHLFFIDADLRWEPRAFVGLLQSDRDVCCGIYRRRQEPETYPVRFIEEDDGGLQIVDGGWIPCDRAPTGFLCIKRHVIEKMVAKAPMLKISGQNGLIPSLFYTKNYELDDGTLTMMGEDFCWSEDYLKQFDQPIWAWPDFDFVHGGFKGNWQHWIRKQVEAKQEELKNQAADQDAARSVA